MITFDPLWKTLEKTKISQYALTKDYGVSTGTLDALRKNKSITLNTLNDLCNILQCQVWDVIAFIPDQPVGKSAATQGDDGDLPPA